MCEGLKRGYREDRRQPRLGGDQSHPDAECRYETEGTQILSLHPRYHAAQQAPTPCTHLLIGRNQDIRIQTTTPVRLYGYPKCTASLFSSSTESLVARHGDGLVRVLHVGAEPPLAELVENNRGVNEEANEKETESRLASRSSFQQASWGNLQKHDRNSNPTGSRRASHDHDKRNDDKRRLHNVDDEEEFRAQRATATLDDANDFEDEVDEEHDDDDAQESLDPAEGHLGVVLARIVLDPVGVRDEDAELDAKDGEADNHDKHAQDPKGDEDALEKGRRLLADVGGRHGGGWVGVGCDGCGEESGGADCRKAVCLHRNRGSMSER